MKDIWKPLSLKLVYLHLMKEYYATTKNDGTLVGGDVHINYLKGNCTIHIRSYYKFGHLLIK